MIYWFFSGSIGSWLWKQAQKIIFNSPRHHPLPRTHVFSLRKWEARRGIAPRVFPKKWPGWGQGCSGGSRGGARGVPLLIFRPKRGPKGQKVILEAGTIPPPSLFYLRVWMTGAPPLSEGLDPPLGYHHSLSLVQSNSMGTYAMD